MGGIARTYTGPCHPERSRGICGCLSPAASTRIYPSNPLIALSSHPPRYPCSLRPIHVQSQSQTDCSVGPGLLHNPPEIRQRPLRQRRQHPRSLRGPAQKVRSPIRLGPRPQVPKSPQVYPPIVNLRALPQKPIVIPSAVEGSAVVFNPPHGAGCPRACPERSRRVSLLRPGRARSPALLFNVAPDTATHEPNPRICYLLWDNFGT
jgi:hypothetical protein